MSTITHKDCGGEFTIWTIRAHNFVFTRCDKCGHYLGGTKVQKKVEKLMRTKVYPTMEKF